MSRYAMLRLAAALFAPAIAGGQPLGVLPPAVPHIVQAKIDAGNARTAANSAKDAASIANQVAAQSVIAADNANKALNDAHDVIHAARISSQGLSSDQQEKLKKAEARLKATMVTLPPTEIRVGDAATGKTQVVENRVDRLQNKIAKNAATDEELASMQEELRQLQTQLDNGATNKEDKSVEQMDTELQELREMLKSLEEAQRRRPANQPHDDLKVEIEHLKAAIGRLGKYGEISATLPDKVIRPEQKGEMRYRMAFKKQAPKVQLTPLADIAVGQSVQSAVGGASGGAAAAAQAVAVDAAADDAADDGDDAAAAPVAGGSQGIDIDTAMPYGELEPFGREDTAQELTEASIHESDAMVDQLERAEVAEEKRSVFRALTRLRGAAITSFDGVARSQTGNIDEYNKVHKWRTTHPLRHLADEESDVAKWAFPDDADF